jgi:hypothetical protein
MLEAELRLEAPRELSIWVCRPEPYPPNASAPPPPRSPNPPLGCVEGRAPALPYDPEPPAPPRASPTRPPAGAVFPIELLTCPGCLLDFHAELPLAGKVLAPPPPRLIFPVLILVLRLMLMLALPP